MSRGPRRESLNSPHIGLVGNECVIRPPAVNSTTMGTMGECEPVRQLFLIVDQARARGELIGVLLNLNFPQAESQLKDLQEAAPQVGVTLRVLRITADHEINATFETIYKEKIGALVVAGSPFFDTLRDKIVALAEHYRVPAVYNFREYTAAGGLISYGIDIRQALRQVGLYAGQILKGAKPGDLPIVFPSKFELVINTKAAKALNLTIPPTLLARADEVIE